MTEFIHWENAEGMSHKMRFVGLVPIVLDESVYFTTQLFMKKEHEVQSFGGVNTVSASAVNGEMILYCQPHFPDLWDDDNGVPKPVRMEVTADDHAVALDKVLFSKKRKLPGYEKCDAAYVEFVAEGMSMTEIEKSINTRVTI